MFKRIVSLLFLLQVLESVSVVFLCAFVFVEHHMTSVLHTTFLSVMLGLSIANVVVTLGFVVTVPILTVVYRRRRAQVAPSIPTAQVVSTVPPLPPIPPIPPVVELSDHSHAGG